jgi:hypothetical protein
MVLAAGADGDFNVVAQSREELDEASNREVSRAVAHQQRDLRLLHAEDFGDFDLCHAAVLEDGIDLQGEVGLEEFLLGIGKAKVCEDVSAALGYAGDALACFSGFGVHFSSAFLDSPARLRRAAV